MGLLRQATLYTNTVNVAIRLANKVQFQEDPTSLADGELPNDLFLQLIQDAETAVEQDLRGRYLIPFQSVKQKGSFVGLPDHTKRAIRMVVDMKAAIMVFTIDFGAGSHLASDPYTKSLEDMYDKSINALMGQDVEASQENRHRWTPPLEDLALAPSNSMADDGFRGMVINTDGGPGIADYAEGQVNDPSLGLFPTYYRR